MLGHWGQGSGHCPRRQGELALLLAQAGRLHSSSQAGKVTQQDRQGPGVGRRAAEAAGTCQESGLGALTPLLGMGQVALSCVWARR